MTAMLSSDWKSFWKHPSHPLHFDIFHFSFIKKKGLEDSGMTGFRTKGKPWGTDDLSGCIPLNECCCLIISRNSLWLNMDVVKDYSNDPGCLKGRFWSPPIVVATWDTLLVRGKAWCCGCRSVPWYSNWLVDEWEARSFNCNCVCGCHDENEAFQAKMVLNQMTAG